MMDFFEAPSVRAAFDPIIPQSNVYAGSGTTGNYTTYTSAGALPAAF